MILTRLGNKRRIANDIIRHFPPEETIKTYIEPFFGAGGMFFNKPRSQYNILNDLDSEVYNLFCVVRDRHEELGNLWVKTPIHEDLWKYWLNNTPDDPIERAVRFLHLSNFSYLGKMRTIRWNTKTARKLLMERLEATGMMIYECEFMNTDFRDIFKRISMSDTERQKAFVYNDPPYLQTANNYSSGFKFKDSEDLFETLENSKIRWSMSEFDHPFILKQARDRNLNVIEIGERKNLHNRRMEILVTNY